MFADNPDFYPTPRNIARRMLAKITNKEAKYYLEPSAGKGDIADTIKNPCTYDEFKAENPREHNEDVRDHRSAHHWRSEDRRVNIDVIESYPALIDVLRGKEYEVVGFDWLGYEGVSYYDAIVMNPPFSDGAKHLLKAWDFLHNGEIVCLLNEETLKNPHTEDRQRLARIVEQFGSVEYLGDCFSTAERQTGVNVAMVYLKKIAPDDTADLWAKDTTQEKHYGAEFDGDVQMLAIRDNLANMEHWFNMANEHWMKGIEHIRKAKFLMDQNKISEYSSRDSDDTKTILAMALSNVQTCRAEFLRSHRRRAWTSVFEQMEFNRWLDSKQQDTFMRDVQRDSTIPFTAQNIRATLDNVFMSRKKLFEESVARVFDDLCGHAVENGCGPIDPHAKHWNRGRGSEGWKTNDNYKVNKKLIFPHGISWSYGSFNTYGGGDSRTIYSDIDRILCVLDGKQLKDCYTVGAALERASRGAKTGGTFESEYFEGRFYKKGTVHLKWKRDDLWQLFNTTAAAGKKWLGEDTQQYRPKKRKDGHDADNWQCRSGHSFVNGVCEHCEGPEVDEVEAVECDFCRVIFEHTGRKHCPIHEEYLPAFAEQDMNVNTEMLTATV